MRNQEMLSLIKEIRDVLDTVAEVCRIDGKNAMNVWAEVLQDGDRVKGIGFGMNMLHKVAVLEGLLYSIQVKAEKIKSGKCDKEMRDVA